MLPTSPTEGPLTLEELQLATRNRGMPLEALRWELTPTGLHYLLVHFDIPMIDAASWRLRIEGCVERPLELSLAELRALPAQTLPVTLECAGNGRARLHPRPVSQPWLHEAVGTAEWTGTPLVNLLARAGLRPEAVELVFTGADHGIEKGREQDYARALSLDDARRPEVLLAYEMNGRPLEPQHGFPLRLLVPGWYGMTHVKWLTRIVALDRPFDGYQQSVAYWFKNGPDDPGTPVRRIRPRALLVPPGFPDFFTRARTVDAGPVRLEGRAWSGQAEITRVEVGVDDVRHVATLEPALGPFAWRRFTFEWPATPGEHLLTCRAFDGSGDAQPTSSPWNLQGMGNNEIQRIPVTVREPL